MSPVESVIEKAARRRLLVTSVEHSAVALAAVLAGAILLLLLGTEILNWPWLVLLAVAGFAIALERTRRAMLSRYRVAQIVDRKLALHDSLSTAWFLLQTPEHRDGALASAQIQFAERKAEQVDPPAVFPFRWRRTWTLVCALSAVAFGLFALRYLVTSSLSLRHALVPVPSFSAVAAIEHLEKMLTRNSESQPLLATTGQREAGQGDGPRQNERDSQNKSDSSAASAAEAKRATEKGSAGAETAPNGKNGDRAEARNSSPGSSRNAKGPGENSGKPQQSASAKEKSGGDARPGASSLSDKMRDALSGLMEKMKPQSTPAESPAANAKSANGQRAGENASEAQRSTAAPSSQAQQGQNREQAGQNVGQPQATETAASRAQAASSSPGQKSADAQSGIGRQNGEKQLREAEQLRAMGKLDEIIGRRSAALTGDMTIETNSNHQQLQTQYSGRVSRHADLGGVIERDEVPPALQNYVREYMEQVHKQANGTR